MVTPVLTLFEIQINAKSLPQSGVKLRSSFVALSGHDDSFNSIHDLCSTVCDGVFLEENVIPYVDVSDKDLLLNSYLLDFFKHGDTTALVKANKIRKGEIWFKLNDFSLILATIITSMKNFMGMKEDDALDFDEVRGSGDAAEELAGEKDAVEEKTGPAPAWTHDDGKGMARVLTAFKMLKKEFDEKFRAMWA